MPNLALSLPTLETHPANPPETRPARVAEWLADAVRKDAAVAARGVGDALAATNRVAMNDARRLELAELYWSTAATLWQPLERHFSRATHPLTGDALEAAKGALTLAAELSTAYKHLLAREADKRLLIGSARSQLALVSRCLNGTVRVLTNSYLAYAPVPPRTWHDAHAIYVYARSRSLHQSVLPGEPPEATPERLYTQALLLALANPYGFLPGQLATVLRYLNEFGHWAKLTDVPPVHRMAKAVAIVPVGHDFPPFSANKGGSIDGSKLFLLTFDLAFQIQEQLRGLEAGGNMPAGIAADPAMRTQYVVLLKRLLRQWAIPPARQFNRLPSRARVVMCAGLAGVWQYSRGEHARVSNAPAGLPAMTTCQVINHTPAGYALRQIDPAPAALRIGDLIALRVEGRSSLQVAIVRWFRNTLKSTALEFGCELLSDAPEAAAAAPEDAADGALTPVVVLPEESDGGPDGAQPQLIAPAGVFAVEQAVSLRRGGETGFAVLTKLADQGPGFDLYEFVAVG